MVLTQIKQRNSRKDNHTSGKCLRHREADSRDEELICTQSLDPDSAKRISEDIQKKKLSFIFLMLPVQHQQDQKHGAPY